MFQALLTALLSGLFSGFVLFGLNEKRDRLSERAKKLEEAYLAYSDWGDSILAYYGRVHELCRVRTADFEIKSVELSTNLDKARHKARLLLYFYVDDAEQLENGLNEWHRKIIDVWHPANLMNLKLKDGDSGFLSIQQDLMKLADSMGPNTTGLVREQLRGMSVIARQGRSIVNRPYLFQVLSGFKTKTTLWRLFKPKPAPPPGTPSAPHSSPPARKP